MMRERKFTGAGVADYFDFLGKMTPPVKTREK